MKLSQSFKEALLLTMVSLYVLLFVYAAISKLIDFEHFQIQIGRSPMLSAIAAPVAWAVPIIELIIAGMLCTTLLRLAGLYAAFSLMVMFSVYIIIILNWSFYVPCSCGGILSEMGWGEHLTFNFGFVLLAILAIGLESTQSKYKIPFPALLFRLRTQRYAIGLALLILATLSTCIMVFLYALSEHGIHRNNAFLRRYPHHPAIQGKGMDITYNSYYIAGLAGSALYLGNSSAPMHLLAIDTSLQGVRPIRIVLKGADSLHFSSVRVRVGDPYFYVADGNLPAVFRGRTGIWKAQRKEIGNERFSEYVLMENENIATRRIDPFLNKSVLGTLSTASAATAHIKPELLQEQGKGIFDTDGMLCYNRELKQLVYIYFYRNEFMAFATGLELQYSGHTIDTISRAVVSVAKEDFGRVETLAASPLIVNQYACSAGRYLYIKSKRIGRYEEPAMLKETAIIDVYDIVSHRYEFSFYLYNYKGEEVESFVVSGDLLIGLTQHYVVSYRLQRAYFNFNPISLKNTGR